VVIIVDTAEPAHMVQLLQQSIPVTVAAANDYGLADYSWVSVTHRKKSRERKHASEILSTGLDEVETQLRRQLDYTDDLELVVEGFWVPAPGGTFTYQPRASQRGVYMEQSFYHIRYDYVMSWILGLEDYGVPVKFTHNIEGTAAYLVTAYKFEQKEEHTTLRRYTREKNTWHPDRRISLLLGIRGVGEKRAEAMLGRYGSVHGIADALQTNQWQVAELPGMGADVASFMRLVLESREKVVGS
jgi:hypothetical protein